MYTQSNKSLIISLVMFYLLFNVYIGKYYNILVFLILFGGLNNFITDKTTLLITIYCIIITISIIKHFHLLENFENVSNKTPRHINRRSKPKARTKLKARPKPNYKEHLDELSESLINKYIKNKKHKTSTRRVLISDLIPTKSELSSSKIKGITTNKNELKQPIVITNDNFIIDGHHRWYIHKSKMKSGSASSEDKEFITCVIINNIIIKFLKSIIQFKQDYNSKTMDTFKIDLNKIQETKKAINTIKKNIGVIEKYNNELNKLNII